MFDQDFWADFLSWKELGVRCSSLKKLEVKELVRTSCRLDIVERIDEAACELLKSCIRIGAIKETVIKNSIMLP